MCVCVQLKFMGNVDVDRVSAIFRDALSSFMGRRKSPLTAQMFTDLFTRFPVSAATCRKSGSGHHGDQTSRLIQLSCFFQALCVNLLDAAVQHITSGVRVHQQVKISSAAGTEISGDEQAIKEQESKQTDSACRQETNSGETLEIVTLNKLQSNIKVAPELIKPCSTDRSESLCKPCFANKDVGLNPVVVKAVSQLHAASPSRLFENV